MLHEEGYQFGSRKFKLFTFSRLMGKMLFDPQKGFTFFPPLSFIIASPKIDILESLAQYLVKKREFYLGENKIWTESIEVMMEKKPTEKVNVEMLSPIVAYSTLYTQDGRKKTYYYNPWEKDFAEIIRENLIKKYTLINGSLPNSVEFHIVPLGVKKNHEKILIYKETVIHGWMGRYELAGNPGLIQTGYDAGLGSKNAQGFGCFEFIEERRCE